MKGFTYTFKNPKFPSIHIDEKFFKIKSQFDFKYRSFNFMDVKNISHNVLGKEKGDLTIRLKNDKEFSYKISNKSNSHFENTLELIKKQIDSNYKMDVYIAPEHNNHNELQQIDFDFKEFVMLNLNFPEISFIVSNEEPLVVELDLEFEVDKKSNTKNIKLSKHRNPIPRTSTFKKHLMKTDSDVFLNCAIRVIEGFKKWKPHTFNGCYVKKNFYKTIYFTYHPSYFTNKNSFELNPDVRPRFNNENKMYENIIKCKYGCDGSINVSCIIDEKGNINDIKIIGSGGKISSTQAIVELKGLGKLNPGVKNKIPVASQLDIMIYI